MSRFDWESFQGILAQFLVRHDSGIERRTNLEAAGLESLSLVELVAQLEIQLDVEFPAELLNWDTFKTAGSLFDATSELMQ